MLGYQTSIDKSMNGIKTLSDGQSILSNGAINCNSLTTGSLITNGLLVNGDITANNIWGTIRTTTQNYITSIGTLISLTITGLLTCGNILSNQITINAGFNFILSGTSIIYQFLGTGINLMSSITMNDSANLLMSGSGYISQSGSGSNTLKASQFNGQISQNGSIIQSSGGTTLLDSNIGNITQNTSKTITQITGGTGTNYLNTTDITNLVVTNSMTIPSNITMPSATYNGDMSFIGTAKINQSGSTGINAFNSSNFNSYINLSGNLTQTNSASTSTFYTPTISGLITCADISQISGTSALRGLSCNQLDMNINYDIVLKGTGKINQSTATGINSLNQISMNANQDIILSGTGKLNQSTGTGTNLLNAITMNANQNILSSGTSIISQGVGTGINLLNSITLGANNNLKYSGNGYIQQTGTGTNIFLTSGFTDINFSGNINSIAKSVFAFIGSLSSDAQTQINNISSTGSTNTTSINNLNTKTTDLTYTTGTSLSTFTNNFKVSGTTSLIGNLTFSGNINTITPTIFGYISNLSSDVQNQITNLTNNSSTAISALQQKTTDLTYSSNVSNFANDLNVGGLMINPVFITKTNNLISQSMTLNDTGLVGTYTVSNHYTKTINFITPLSFSVINANDLISNSMSCTLSTITCTVFKNGVSFSTVTLTLSNPEILGSGTLCQNTNSTAPHSCDFYLTNCSGSFTPNDDVLQAVYTVKFTFTKTNTNASYGKIIVNTTTSNLIAVSMSCSYTGTRPTYKTPSSTYIYNYSNDRIGSIEASDIQSSTITTNSIISTSNTSTNSITNNISTSNYLISPQIKTYDDVINSTSFAKVSSGVNCTFVFAPHYGQNISFLTPLTLYKNGSATVNSYNLTFTSATCSITKNGVSWGTVAVSSSNGFNITKVVTGSGLGSFITEQFYTNLTVNFIPDDSPTIDTYNLTFAITGSSYTGVYFNSAVSTFTTTNSSNGTCITASGVNYIASNYWNVPNYVDTSRTGSIAINHLNVNNISAKSFDGSVIFNDVYYNGRIACYMINGINIGVTNSPTVQWYPLFTSGNFADVYRSYQPTTFTPSVGTVFTSAQHIDNVDDLYFLMPNFGIQVLNISSVVVLYVPINNTGKPLFLSPTVANTGNAYFIYYNGVQI